MTGRSVYSLALLFAALVACEVTDDADDDGEGGAGTAQGGNPESGGARPQGGAGASVGGNGGSAAGSGSGGTVSGRSGAAMTSGGDIASSGQPSKGGTSGGGTGGTNAGGNSGGSTSGGGNGTSGGSGGEGASAGSAGAAGEGNEPHPVCADPIDTEDVSRLMANETMSPYFVSGNSAGQIRQSIDQSRDTDYDAFTDWYVSWQFADCNGGGLVVSVELTYTYPEWTAPATASIDLVDSWDSYMKALFCHEYGHAKHGIDCANEVYTALAALDSDGNCNEQQAKAEAAFDAILDKYNELDIQYDDDTSHGATMGAVFPPRRNARFM